MELIGISEYDLKFLLFVEFPTNISQEEARERLELMVYEAYEEAYAGVDQCDRPDIAITPYLVHWALCIKHRNEAARRSEHQRVKDIEFVWKVRGMERDGSQINDMVAVDTPQSGGI